MTRCLMGTERQVPAARELALKVKSALREQVEPQSSLELLGRNRTVNRL
jgi:hypothetical protein